MITGIVEKHQTKNKSAHELAHQPASWQRALATAVRDPFELMRLLELDAMPGVSLEAARQFRLLAPHSYVRRMRKGDPHDPLLRQILPLDAELQPGEGYQFDPVGDQQAMVADGVLHKYQGRVLLVTTGACAVHCRYCFRRHFPYADANPARADWQAAVDYISANADVEEVLLSGGDPLTLSDERLQVLCEKLADIPHVRRIRFHSRLPVVLPERIDAGFIAWISALPVQVIMVIHANHAQELDASDVRQALSALRMANVLLLNQAVLLRGVNDTVASLRALSEALIEQQVMPYYLHVLDKVQGAAHFDVPETEALALLAALRQQVPGYMMPQLVREVAGEASKTPITG